jgi:hypothetical protein
MGCYSPSPLIEISSRDLRNEGEHKKQRWTTHWPRSKKDGGTVDKGETSRLCMPLFLSCVYNISPCRIRWCLTTLLVLHFIIWSSWFNNSSRSSERKRTFSYPRVKGDILHRAGTSKLNRTLARSKMIFSGTLGQEGYTSARLRSWQHGLRVDWCHVEYSLEISDTQAPIE